MVRINVAKIKDVRAGTIEFAFELTAAELALAEDELQTGQPISVTGQVSNAGDVLLLQAEIVFTAKRVCGRCLKEFTQQLSSELTEKFFPAGTQNIENDAFTYDSDLLDITEAVRESVLLAIPLQALCKETCLGLCPVCGKDRNAGACGCDTDVIDPRLAALQQFIKH